MGTLGRFAPSPSGRMHLGNVFSALIAWLEVRSAGGRMLLRMEDLDPDRCKKEYADTLRRDLEFLGLDWDEEQAPQSLRGDAYREAFERLSSLGAVYPCYCSRTQLHAASAPHASDGNYIYPGTCRNLSQAEREKMTRLPAWRLRVPDKNYAFTDLLQGAYAENLQKDCGDFIIRRSDGVYAYQLAVVTDDAAGGVTQIVRGKDLLSSTPRQIYLRELLSLGQAEYLHVPLLCDGTGRRLSKRDGDLDLGILREKKSAAEILGLLAFASGILPENAPATAEELKKIYLRKNLRKEDIPIRKYL